MSSETEDGAEMVEVLGRPPATEADLAEWYKLQEQLRNLKFQEMFLRRHIFSSFFPGATEGSHVVPISNGFELVAKVPYDYKVDEASFKALKEEFEKAGLAADKLVRWKPELEKRQYNTLTAEEKLLFDQCMTIKPGSPSLAIREAKKGAK